MAESWVLHTMSLTHQDCDLTHLHQSMSLGVKGVREYGSASEKKIDCKKKICTKARAGGSDGEKKSGTCQMLIYCCLNTHSMNKCVVIYTLVLDNTMSIHMEMFLEFLSSATFKMFNKLLIL